MQFDITFNGLDEAIAATRNLENFSPKEVFERYFKGYLRPTLIDRYKIAASQTPYAPSSLGTTKRVTGAVRGGTGDPGFGVDSRNLLMDFVGESPNHVIDDSQLLLFSDLVYAGYIDSLFATKSPFPDGVFTATDTDQEAIAQEFGDYLEELFNANP